MGSRKVARSVSPEYRHTGAGAMVDEEKAFVQLWFGKPGLAPFLRTMPALSNLFVPKASSRKPRK